MHLDFAPGIGENIPVVDGAGGLRRLAVAGVGDVELGPLNRSARHTVLLEDGQLRGLVVLERDGFLIAGVQADRLLPVCVPAGEVVGRGHGLLRDFVGAGGQPQGNRSVRAGGHIVAIVAVNGLDGEHSAGDNIICIGIKFGDGQKGLLQIIENQLPFLAGAEVDGLHGFIPHHIGVRDGLLNDFITVHGDIGQDGLSVRPGGHVVVIAVVDALDLKDGSGNDLLGLRVPLEDGQAGQLLIRRRHGDSAAAVDSGLIHMGDNRLSQCGIGGRGAHLHKSVHPLGHVRYGDGAVRLGGLRADDLAVLDDVEHRAGEGVIAVVQLNQLDFHFGVIFKDKGDVGLAVPAEGLLGLIHIGAFGVALRGRDFLGGVAAEGHILPGYVGQVAAGSGDICAGKIIVHALNFNNRSGQPLGGIVRVHLADAALAGNGGGIRKGDGHGVVAIAGQDNVLRSSVVDLVALRGLQLGYGISARIQSGQGICPVLPRHNLFGEGAIFRTH